MCIRMKCMRRVFISRDEFRSLHAKRNRYCAMLVCRHSRVPECDQWHPSAKVVWGSCDSIRWPTVEQTEMHMRVPRQHTNMYNEVTITHWRARILPMLIRTSQVFFCWQSFTHAPTAFVQFSKRILPVIWILFGLHHNQNQFSVTAFERLEPSRLLLNDWTQADWRSRSSNPVTLSGIVNVITQYWHFRK